MTADPADTPPEPSADLPPGTRRGSSTDGSGVAANRPGSSAARSDDAAGGADGAVGGADGAVERGDASVDATRRPEAGGGGTSRAEHAIRGTLAAGLILEGLTVLFVPQTVAALSDDGLGAVRLGLLLGLAVALFVAAGLQRSRAGLVLGSALQVPVIATGLMVGAMWVLGLVFAGIWVYLLRVRQEILAAAARGAPPPD